MRRTVLAATAATALTAGLFAGLPTSSAADESAAAAPAPSAKAKSAIAIGKGGAVTSVDPNATRVGLNVLKRGGNAVDAAVATAAALGVTEPYSAGIGGGGYFVYYNAKSGQVKTIDGRETAPLSMPNEAFIDPATGAPYNFTPELVTSGVSVGVPGTPLTWENALARWGTWTLADALKPGIKLARDGFRVDDTFRQQTLDNKDRFAAFTSTSALYLKGGDAPAVGSTFKNKDLAATYEMLAEKGTSRFYRGALAREIVQAVRTPPRTASTTLPIPPGFMRTSDLRRYRTVNQRPTKVSYRGLDVYGMGSSSSGGTTVGEALNILERYDLAKMSPQDALHHYFEASALAYADRAKYVGDSAFVNVPYRALLDKKFAAERACLLNPTMAAPKPVGPGNVSSYDGSCATLKSSEGSVAEDNENISTTNLTVADQWGNVVEYTLTIEQTGGSGIVVPGRGFLLNNELTDFSTVYDPADPNRIQPGKRPRSSMSPTIVLKDGKPFLALGSPGGSTIITTVLQMLINRIDLGMTLPEAIAAPRATNRNTANTTAEPEFITQYGALLAPYGQVLVPAGDAFTSAAEIGAATAIEFNRFGKMTAVAEPQRRGGGSAKALKNKP